MTNAVVQIPVSLSVYCVLNNETLGLSKMVNIHIYMTPLVAPARLFRFNFPEPEFPPVLKD